MVNSILEIKLTKGGPIAVPPGENVIFNEPVLSPPGIDYNLDTGIIKFNEIGQYSVQWWIATETTLKGAIGFHLQTSQGKFTPGCSPIKTGQVTGFAVVDIDTVGTTLSLINRSTTNTMISRN